MSLLGVGKGVESPPSKTKKDTIAKNEDQQETGTCEKLSSSHLPRSIFSRALCEQLATMQVKSLVNEAPPQATHKTDAFVARYKKLEGLLRHAMDSGDFTALFNRNKPMVDKEPHRISDAVRLAAQRQVCDRLQSDLLTQEEMRDFCYTLEKWANKTPKPMKPAWFQWVVCGMREKGMLLYDMYIDYVAFTKARAEMHPKIREWLTTTKFFTLMTESDDTIFRRLPIVHLYNYVTKKVWLVQVRLGLAYYDVDGQGYLTEESMEAYIRDMIPTLPHLDEMDPTLEPFYLCAATRKFFFFLDPRRIDKVQIAAIISSLLLDDIFELHDLEVRTTNWFGVYSLLRIYKHYVYLDTDANGMLSPKEFLKFNYSSRGNQVCLTETFVNALFSEKMTYHGEMDFRTYIDFVLAIENKNEEQSISYFVKVLDVHGKGYLNSSDLHYFYKDVYKILFECSLEPPKFEDIKTEIFDMIKPSNPCRITAADLFSSGKGGYVIGMLIDAKTLDEAENLEIVGNS